MPPSEVTKDPAFQQFAPGFSAISEFSICTPLLKYELSAAVPPRLRAIVTFRSSGVFAGLPLNVIALGVAADPEATIPPWLPVKVAFTMAALPVGGTETQAPPVQ